MKTGYFRKITPKERASDNGLTFSKKFFLKVPQTYQNINMNHGFIKRLIQLAPEVIFTAMEYIHIIMLNRLF